MIYYKIIYMGFSLKPKADAPLWLVESRISFDGNDEPVTVSLAVPDNPPGYTIQNELSPVRQARFKIEKKDGIRRAIWNYNTASKKLHRLYYLLKVFKSDLGREEFKKELDPPGSIPEPPLWQDTAKVASEQLIAAAKSRQTKDKDFVTNLIRLINEPKNPQVNALLLNPADQEAKYRLLVGLLSFEKIAARKIQGVFLTQGKKWQNPDLLAEVYFENRWHIYNLDNGKEGLPEDFLVFRRGGSSMFDVVGGIHSKIRFSVTKSAVSANYLYPARAKKAGGGLLLYFSIYSLPSADQNAFKKLVMIPLGILVIVLLRNIVGLNTMGTFMPVLLTLAFLETKLVPGLVLFSVIVFVGLLIRFYLSCLNLLLTPRISAVVILVIIMMIALSIISFHVGLHEGMTVTFFPLIIIAWTIERSSIIWEEDGPLIAMKQLATSVGAGVLCYLIMSNNLVQHIMYSFMELNLVVMGVILLLGTYTGYRLSELHRFASLVKKDV